MCYLQPYYYGWHFSTVAIASCEVCGQKEEKTWFNCEGNMTLPQRVL